MAIDVERRDKDHLQKAATALCLAQQLVKEKITMHQSARREGDFWKVGVMTDFGGYRLQSHDDHDHHYLTLDLSRSFIE